jgi:hypothetical protein
MYTTIHLVHIVVKEPDLGGQALAGRHIEQVHRVAASSIQALACLLCTYKTVIIPAKITRTPSTEMHLYLYTLKYAYTKRDAGKIA